MKRRFSQHVLMYPAPKESYLVIEQRVGKAYRMLAPSEDWGLHRFFLSNSTFEKLEKLSEVCLEILGEIQDSMETYGDSWNREAREIERGQRHRETF